MPKSGCKHCKGKDPAVLAVNTTCSFCSPLMSFGMGLGFWRGVGFPLSSQLQLLADRICFEAFVTSSALRVM